MNTSSQKIRWEEMFPDELMQAIEQQPVCYMAYGLAEPHGAYNALGLDWLKAKALLERAAGEFGGVVAPPCAWHIQEQQHFRWLQDEHGIEQSLCSSIPADLFLQLVLSHIRAIDARGFNAAVLLTGHYGGLENDMRLLCEFYTRRTGSPLQIRAMADGELIQYEIYHGDHAGICETAQLMALRPELVDLNRKDSESPTGPWIGTEFPLPDGRMPSRKLGEKIVESQIKRLGEIVKEMLNSYEPKPDWKAPNHLDCEEIWTRFERLTRKYWWNSLTLPQLQRGEFVPFPGWEELGE